MTKQFPAKRSDDLEPLKPSLDSLYLRVSGYIDSARQNVQRTIDTEMLKAYWKIGRDIVEAEQHGEARAQYGQALIQALSQKLTNRYGKGFSETNVRNMRKFYLEYQSNSDDYPIQHTVCTEFQPEFMPCLGWSHYRLLMRVTRPEARAFYEIEASNNNWSARELERQIGSLLFDRLAKSRDKAGVMELAYKGQELNQPEDVIKGPFVLEISWNSRVSSTR
jgi:hypothetical protein